jgi:hypothetical protein
LLAQDSCRGAFGEEGRRGEAVGIDGRVKIAEISRSSRKPIIAQPASWPKKLQKIEPQAGSDYSSSARGALIRYMTTIVNYTIYTVVELSVSLLTGIEGTLLDRLTILRLI